MAAVAGPVGLVEVALNPPVEFIERQAGAFLHYLTDLTGLWDRLAADMSEFEEQRWETEGFGAWPPLAESTLAEKERRGWPLDPLVRTGALKESLTNPAQAARIEPEQMIWGTQVEYAPFHQTGTSRMPQRIVLDIDLEQRRTLESSVVSYVNEAAYRAWRAA